MKQISRYPFESLFVFILVYFVAIVFFFEATSIYNKLLFFFVAITIFIILIIFSFSFRSEIDRFRAKFFSVFLSGRFQKSFIILKIVYLLKMSILPWIIASVFEFILTFVFTEVGGITIGFPLPVYSFTANRLLPLPITVDLVLYMIVVYFIGYVLMHDPDAKE